MSRRKKSKARNTILLILDVIIVLVVIYFILGYINFFKISKEQEPLFEGQEIKYERGKGEVTVHDYKIYKIVEHKIPKKNISYSLKLWFMEDVK